MGMMVAFAFLGVASACTSIGAGSLCDNTQVIPDCSWIKSHSGTICDSLSPFDVVNGDGCSLALNGCVYSDTEVLGAPNFCCLPKSEVRMLQELSGSASASASASANARPSNTPVISSSATTTCAYRVYNAANDFSASQGQNGWYYGYYNGAGVYTQFTNYGFATGSLGSVNSWNYNSASNGNIGALMIMPNGAEACNTNTYGDVAPVLRWYNPVGSCFQDVTVTVSIGHGSPNGGVIAGLTINGVSVYANSAGGTLSYSGVFNQYGVRSVELSIGPLNSKCDYGQTTYSLNIAPMGPSFSVLPSVTVSASYKQTVSVAKTGSPSDSAAVTKSPSISPSGTGSYKQTTSLAKTGSTSGSTSVTKSASVSASISRSHMPSGSPSHSATASATVFYNGIWTDYGAYYWSNPTNNIGALTISACMTLCWTTPFCGGISVNTPCNNIPLNSPSIYSVACSNCFLMPSYGTGIGSFVSNAGWESFIYYDKMFPPTQSSVISATVTQSAIPTSSLAATRSVISWSSYNMCAASGTTLVLPFIGSGVGLTTNAAGTNYADGLNCGFTVAGGSASGSTGTSGFSVNITSFVTEECCDFLTIYNDAGTVLYRTSGVRAGTTLTYSGTNSLRFVFNTDGSVTFSGVSFSVNLVTVPSSVSANATVLSSFSSSARVSRSGSSSASLSTSPMFTSSPVRTGWVTGSIGETLSRASSSSSSISQSISAEPSYSTLVSRSISASALESKSASDSSSVSQSPSHSQSASPSYSSCASISSSGSAAGGSVSPSESGSGCPTITTANSQSSTASSLTSGSMGSTYSILASVTVCASQSLAPTISGSPTLCASQTLAPTISGSVSWSMMGSPTPSMSPSNLKPAGPPPALPANLSSLSLTALNGLFNDMSNYPPTLIGDNLQKLGFAALANSPGGEFGITTSVFSVKVKALPMDTNVSAVPLSVGKTAISMPLIGGAAAASAILWTADPYNSGVAPDSSVLSLNVLDSRGSSVTVKNSSAPIVISMNLNPVPGDPRFAPLPSYLADCTAGLIYVKTGLEFREASNMVNVTGAGKWSVPCLLGDWRSVNCSAGDTVLRYTCPPLIYTPKCQYWDSTTGGWSTDGCVPTFSNATLMVCSCNHLTDFSSRVNAVVAANQAIFANAASVYSLEGLIRFAQWYGTFGGIALFALLLAYIAVTIDKRGTKAYVAELLHNESINLFLAHNPSVPVYSYDPASKYKARTFVASKKAEPAVPVKQLSFCNRIFLQHNRLQFLFKYDPRLSRLFRLLFLFVLQFHSLFVTALLYNYTYTGAPMMWYDTIILSLITTALNMPVIKLVISQMNAIGMKEFQAQFPLLFDEYERRLDFELHAMYYIFKKPEDKGASDDGTTEAAAAQLDFMDDDDSSLFDALALFLCNRPKPPSRTDELIGLSHKDAMRIMVNIVKEPYPYYEQYGVEWQNAPCHTWQGALFIACCCGWLGWCLNYLLLFASAHAVEVGTSVMTSYAASEVSTIFLVQPMTIMITTAAYYLVKRFEKVLPAFIVGFFINRKIKSIPSIFYFSDPWNKKSKSPFTSEFAYNLFVHCPAAASGVNELAYASIAALSENIDGSEVTRLSEVLILYRRVLAVWDEIKRTTGQTVVAALPSNKLSLRNPSFTPNKSTVSSPDTVRSSRSDVTS